MTYTEIKNKSKTECGFITKQATLVETRSCEELIEPEQKRTDNIQALIFYGNTL
jgi:hypothetical protein